MNPLEDQLDDDELLTAYLDGELLSEERSRLQERLMDEPALRGRLAELQKAWDLLDELPDTPVNQEFTKSTLELVVTRSQLEATEETSLLPSRSFRLSGPSLWIVLMAACSSLGLLFGMAASWRAERLERRQLPAVANLPGLKIIETFSALEDFATEEDIELATEQIQVLKSRILEGIPNRLDERQDWVSELSPEKQAILWSRRRDFDRLEQAEKSRIINLVTQIQKAKESDWLQKAITVAGVIYENQSDEERQSLRMLAPEARVDRLRTLLYLYIRDWYAENLDEKDANLLQTFARDKIMREPSVLRLARAMFQGQTIPEQLGLLGDSLPPKFEADLEELMAKLSPIPSRCLENLNHNDRFIAIITWITASLFNNGRNLSAAELYSAYSEWDPVKREKAELGKFSESEGDIRANARRQRRPPIMRNRPGE